MHQRPHKRRTPRRQLPSDNGRRPKPRCGHPFAQRLCEPLPVLRAQQGGDERCNAAPQAVADAQDLVAGGLVRLVGGLVWFGSVGWGGGLGWWCTLWSQRALMPQVRRLTAPPHVRRVTAPATHPTCRRSSASKVPMCLSTMECAAANMPEWQW